MNVQSGVPTHNLEHLEFSTTEPTSAAILPIHTLPHRTPQQQISTIFDNIRAES